MILCIITWPNIANLKLHKQYQVKVDILWNCNNLCRECFNIPWIPRTTQHDWYKHKPKLLGKSKFTKDLQVKVLDLRHKHALTSKKPSQWKTPQRENSVQPRWATQHSIRMYVFPYGHVTYRAMAHHFAHIIAITGIVYDSISQLTENIHTHMNRYPCFCITSCNFAMCAGAGLKASSCIQPMSSEAVRCFGLMSKCAPLLAIDGLMREWHGTKWVLYRYHQKVPNLWPDNPEFSYCVYI